MKNLVTPCSFLLALSTMIVLPVGAQFIQQGSKLVGTGAVGNAQQGSSVCLSANGNTAIVGGYADSNWAGAAWVYTRSGEVWTQQGSKLVGTGAVGNAQQGTSVSLSADGNTAIVGGYADSNWAGAAWVFTRSGGVWTQQGSKLVGTGAVGDNTMQGTSVYLSADGNTAIVGGIGDNGYVGAAWVYIRSGGVWTQQGSKLVGTDAAGSAEQGWSVSLSADGNTAIVGGGADNSYAGAAWVFTRSGGVWTQQGSKLVGTGAVGGAWQGSSVSLSADGNTAIVGGGTDNNQAGAIWVFTRSGGVWTQQGSKLVGTGAVGDYVMQGSSVSLSTDGNTVIVSGPGDNDWAGAIWVFTRSGGVWTQQGSKLVGTGAVGSADQGYSVSLSADGSTVIVGGPGDNSNAGAAWVYMGSFPVITAVNDIPDDQGRQVRLQWKQSAYDNSLYSPQVSSYSIFRQSSAGPSPAAKARRIPEGIVMDSSLLGYDYVPTIPAFQLAYYRTVVPTPEDSTSAGSHYFYFRVVAQTTDRNQYYVSGVDSGYSVDNLSSITPQNPPVLQMANLSIQVHANGDRADSDAGNHSMYRGTSTGSPVITAIGDIADDQGGHVRLGWNKSAYDDALVSPQVSSYSIFRQSSSRPSPAAKSRRAPNGIVTDSPLLGYDYVATIPAFQLAYYKTVMPTLEDSTSAGSHCFYFRVVAQTTDLNQYYVSDVDSGWSVDNLSPLSPQNAAILQMANGSINIHWNPDRTDPDVGHFAVYRSTTSGFPLDNGTRLKTTRDTTITDSTTEVGQQYYYRVTTVDIHGNESQPTAELGSTALAIQLASFSATTLTTGVQLEWTTMSETNSQGFYAERRPKNAGAYTTVSDLIPGAGTSLQQHHYQWMDTKVTDGNCNYRLRLVDLSGNTTYSSAITVTVSGVTGVNGSLPTEFALGQNYPNPFNPTTVISYQLPVASYVTLKVYDMLGQELATLVNGAQDAGYKSVEFSAAYASGGLPSGIYTYRLTARPTDGGQAGTLVDVKKMLMLK